MSIRNKYQPVVNGLVSLVMIISLLIGNSIPKVYAEDTIWQQAKDQKTDEILVRFASGTNDSQRDNLLRKHGATKKKDINGLNVTVLKVPSEAYQSVLSAFEASEFVEFAEPNYLALTQETLPNDAEYAQQWGLEAIGAPTAWDTQKGGSDIVIGVIDTGIDLNHPDLQGKYVDGWDFVNNDSEPQDDNGHGTHVAGIMAATTDNGIGIAGVSWGAMLMPIKVLDASGSGSYADVADGIVYAVDHGAKVINLSLGGSAASATLEAAVNYANSHEVVVVAAAGNRGTAGVIYPAYYENSIAVGAIDSTNGLSPFSSQGPEVDLAAPGVNIYSTILGGGYSNMNGTSMAAPMVSGAVAILLSSNNFSSSNDIRSALEITATDLGDPGKDNAFGHGLVQIFKALMYKNFTKTPTSTPVPSETPVPAISPAPSSTPNPKGNVIDFRDSSLDPDLQAAIYEAIGNRPLGLLQGRQFAITSVYRINDWSLLSIASLDGPDSSPDVVGVGDAAGLLIAYYNSPYGWQVEMAGTSGFSTMIQLAPDELADTQAKLLLDPLYIPTSVASVDYKFPWSEGDWQYWWGFHTTPWGVDIGTSGSDKRLLASAAGTITNICSNGTYSANVSIRDTDGITLQYLHIEKGKLGINIRLGATVPQGTVLGTLRSGNFPFDGCGTATQQAVNAHVHWVIPTDRAFTVDGWTITYDGDSDDTNDDWTNGTEIIEPHKSPYHLIHSTNQTQSGSNVGGYIRDSTNASGISNANVTFSGGGLTLTALTDAMGRYEFVEVPPGWSTITASKSGYTTGSVDINVGYYQSIQVPNILLTQIACVNEASIDSDVVGAIDCPTPTPSPTPPPDVTDGLRLISVSSPTVQKGQTFSVNVTYEIVSGSLLESRGDHLHALDSNTYGAWPVQAVSGSYYAGQRITFSFDMTAPQDTGTYESRWQMRVGGNHIGPIAAIRFTVQSEPTPPGGGDAGIYIYDNVDYSQGGGYYAGPLIGDYSYVGDFWNDNIESIRTSGCYSAVLYQDSNFSGNHTHTGGSTDLGSWKNITSSIRTRSCDNAAFTIYSLGDYNGESWASDRTIYDLGHWDKNDWAESMRVASGKGIIACEHGNFHGRCGRVTGPAQFSDINALSQGLRDGVSSIRVCDGNCPSAPNPPTLAYPVVEGKAPSNRDVILQWYGDGEEYYVELWGGAISGTRQFGWSQDTQWNIGRLPESQNPYYWHVMGWNGFGDGGWASGSFYVRPPTVEIIGVFTTDDLGASATSDKEPHLQTDNGSPNAFKDSFNLGDPILLFIDTSNDFEIETVATFEWEVIDPAGRLMGGLSYYGDLSSPPGRSWWNLSSTIPLDAITGNYTYTGSVTYDGQTTTFSTTFFVNGISTVVVAGVFTTDENGTASAGASTPQFQIDQVQPSGFQSDFNAGDPIRLYLATYNSFGVETSATITWEVLDPIGRVVPPLSYSGDMSSPSGYSSWYLSSSIPVDSLTGDYTYIGSITFNGQVTTQTTTFHISGVSTVLSVEAFTTDENGTASVLSGKPQLAEDRVNTNALKNAFNAGDPIRLYMESFSNLPSDATFNLVFEVIDPVGQLVPELYYAGDLITPPGQVQWYLSNILPAELLTGEYQFYASVTYNGTTTGSVASFTVTGQQTVEVMSVFTTDENGTAVAAGSEPHHRTAKANINAIKTSFSYGEPIQLYIDSYNNVPLEAIAHYEWVVTDPLGRTVPALSWSGDLTTPAGWVWWYLSANIPTTAITGEYTFIGSVTYNSQTSNQQVSFHVEGAPQPDPIFSHGFESGNFSEWSSSMVDGGDLSVSSAAALGGSDYGLQAVIDDNNPILLTDDSPQQEDRYRARFYLDPNSLQMAHSNAHTILIGLTDTWGWVFRVSLGSYNGKYYLIGGVIDDSGTWRDSNWLLIGDSPHYVEVDWQAASAASANDGSFTLWIDGEQKLLLNEVDNDTRRIDRARLGAVSGIDTGTRGTYYFDEFESRRSSYIGPLPTDAIFAEGFETGNLSHWAWQDTDSGDLSVASAAALAGSAYGVQATLDDTTPIFLTDDQPDRETEYRARFYFDPNTISMPHNSAHTLFVGMQTPYAWVSRITLGSYNGNYYLIAGLVDDSGVWRDSVWYRIGDNPHYVEIDWRAATAVGANDGSMAMWIDGEQKVVLSEVDNDTRRIDRVRWGAINSIDTGTVGSYFMDEFVSRRTSYIGPVQGDNIFSDGFETGNLSAWAWTDVDGGDLSASTASALVDSYGLHAVIDDNTPIFLTDDQPDDEARYRARFYFDPNSIAMANNDAHTIFIGMDNPYTWIFRVSLSAYNGKYYLIAGLVDDSNTWRDSSWYAISDGPHAVEVDWQAASGTGTNNGSITMWIDGEQRVVLDGVDNDTRRIDRARMGAVAGIDTGTRGAYFFDAFVSQRTGFIGMSQAVTLKSKLLSLSRAVTVGEDRGLPSTKEKEQQDNKEKADKIRAPKAGEDVGLPTDKEKDKQNKLDKEGKFRTPKPNEDVGLPAPGSESVK